MRRQAWMLGLALVAAPAGAQIAWDPKFYDPAGGADLVLPMPCGGAMAFQRIATPVDPTDPLDDRRVRLGGTDPATGAVDYLQPGYLRGGFSDQASGAVFYYLARYELTEAQAAALTGDCAPPTVRTTLPRVGLSWFDAVDLGRRYTEWLGANAAAAVPAEDGVPGFVRLPTETEWEYATRGGTAVSPAEFDAARFPMEGALKDYALHQGADSARGRLRPVGGLKPNPLGLHDLYGSAEEIMLEPFRANNLGRAGGQVGGLVTRGGSFQSPPEQLRSALRQEYAYFDRATGQALALESFGVRFVLAPHIAVTRARADRLQSAWAARLAGPGTAPDDPLAELARMVEAETDPRRRATLEAVRGLVAAETRERDAARIETLRALMLGGAVLTDLIRIDTLDLGNMATLEGSMTTALGGARDLGDAESVARLEGNLARLATARDERTARLALNGLSFERLAVSGTRDYGAAARREALDVLLLELEGSGRGGLRPLVVAFAAVLDAYAAQPDMGRDALIGLALDP